MLEMVCYINKEVKPAKKKKKFKADRKISCIYPFYVLWPPHEKNRLIGKNSDAGRDWGQQEKGTTEDEMAGWHHGLDGRESE